MTRRSGDGWVQRGLGIAAGAVGLTLLGVGSGFGFLALDKRAESDERCPVVDGEERCTVAGVTLNEEAQDAALVANVLLGVGASLSVISVVVVVTAPSPSKQTGAPGVSVRLAPASASLNVVF